MSNTGASTSRGFKRKMSSEGQCEVHQWLPKNFKCINCNKYICSACALLTHTNCPRSSPVLEAFTVMKVENLKKLKVLKAKLVDEARLLDSKLDHLSGKRDKLNQEIEVTESKKKRNQKIHEHLSRHKENLEKATCNEDYKMIDAAIKFFLEENCVDILDSPFSIISKEDTMKLTIKDLKEKTFYVTKGDHEEKKYAKVKVEDDQISFLDWEEDAERGSSCVDFLDFISSRSTVIDTHKFIKKHNNELHSPRLPKDRIKFSKLIVKGRRVYFHLFKTSEGGDFVIEFGGLLKTLGCSSVVPTEAFLTIQSLSVGEVVITADGGSPRALNFLLLASGIMDDSYIGTSFGIDDTKANGGRKINGYVWSLFPGVVEGIRNGGMYQKVIERGDVGGGNGNEPNKLSHFSIWKQDSSDTSRTTFGRVKRGMPFVDEIRGNSVNECGFFFNFP